ncbi:class I SAM-dependent methyltransferase [Membranihabitans maritimus]|uniref:class I SAM-dependent methyltransferase n=1 Tax=Membranihabitans maritimus TaxID=2904244 RepID=UPI001F02DC10|nr:class I SAM-dependent methyltransferase [Membranihabitans maritimus]
MQYERKVIKNNNLTLKWLDYKNYRSEIQSLRRAVFIEEQGLDEFVLDSPADEKGLHLGLFEEKYLVSSVSIFPFKNDNDFIKNKIKLNSKRPYLIQFSRRVELPEYRSRGYSTLMLAHAMRSSYELFQPDCIFAILMGPHKRLKNYYINSYRFNRYEEFSSEDGDGFLLIMDDQDIIDKVATQLRSQSIKLSETLNISLPDMTHHIMKHEILKEYLSLKGDQVNRYLKPLSLQDELPRLSAQARMLYKSQKGIWQKLLADYPQHKNILDIGCGPGIYLSQLKKLEEANDRNLMGIDISDELITYAKFSHSEMDWKVGTVYNTHLEAESVDIVLCSFLFIHLLNPFLALKEIYRILSPEGILYISDVNDSTFDGPKKIRDLIDAHNEIYEGNRMVMSSIHILAEDSGFEQVISDDLKVDNTGTDQKAELNERHYKLGKWSLWGMFSFLGQRSEVKDQFEAAEQHYFNTNSTLSVEIQSRIFKKK